MTKETYIKLCLLFGEKFAGAILNDQAKVN